MSGSSKYLNPKKAMKKVKKTVKEMVKDPKSTFTAGVLTTDPVLSTAGVVGFGKETASAVLDPGNVFGEREYRDGQSQFSGFFDPGGEVLITAGVDEDKVKSITDPKDVFSSGESSLGGGPAVMDTEVDMGDLTPTIDDSYYSSISAANRRRARAGGGRASTMLSSSQYRTGTSTLLGG